MNVCIKKVSHMPAMEIVFFRSAVTVLFTLWMIRNEPVKLTGNSKTKLLLRGLFGTCALFFFFLSLDLMPLATAVTIQFTSPIFTTLIGIIVNKEKVKPIQWLFFAISFSGIILLKGFDTTISLYAFSIGILSSVFSGLAYNMIRSMKETEHPVVIVFHFQVVGVIIGGLSSIYSFVQPSSIEWLIIIAIGILTYLGQINLTNALQGERLGIITSLNYLGIIYAIILGFIFFEEIITLKTFIAMALVTAGVILNVIYGQKSKHS